MKISKIAGFVDPCHLDDSCSPVIRNVTLIILLGDLAGKVVNLGEGSRFRFQPWRYGFQD